MQTISGQELKNHLAKERERHIKDLDLDWIDDYVLTKSETEYISDGILKAIQKIADAAKTCGEMMSKNQNCNHPATTVKK